MEGRRTPRVRSRTHHTHSQVAGYIRACINGALDLTNEKKQVAVEKSYRAMTGREKLAFIGKACVFFISGGFVFPTLWID